MNTSRGRVADGILRAVAYPQSERSAGDLWKVDSLPELRGATGTRLWGDVENYGWRGETRTDCDGMASERRVGGPEGKNRGALLDAAEQLMLDEGYASVTSRRLAERAGLKAQLVHYYFRTMDDLFLAAFRRRIERGSLAQTQILSAVNPVRELWTFLVENRDTALIMEYVALANHRKGIRSEIASATKQFLEAQAKLLGSVLTRHGIAADDLPPTVALSLMVGMSQLLATESALGFSVGRDEIIEYFERHIRKLDGTSGGCVDRL